MARQVKRKDQSIIANIERSITRLYSAEDIASEIARAALSPKQVFGSYEEQLQTGIQDGFSDIRKRLLLIKTKARAQTFHVIWNGWRYLHDVTDLSAEESVIVIKINQHMGIQYGKLPDGASDSVHERLASEYAKIYAYNQATGQLDFSPATKTEFKSHYLPERGCPVLQETVALGALNQRVKFNMYHMYWNMFADDCIRDHIIDGVPYEIPPVINATD